MANPNINPNFAVIGTEFVKAFYECYDDPAKRDGLSNFYHNEAFQSFEDDQRMGKAAILEKIKSLPFQSVAHAITKVDSQPTLDGGVLVSILGQVKVDDDKPMGYSHTFILRPESGEVTAIFMFAFILFGFRLRPNRPKGADSSFLE